MAKKENDATYILDSKKGLPNKLLQADGSVTDIQGNTVVNADKAWDSKPALPNKWLNPDGTYSTLNEIIASMVDTSIYVIVDELPQEGNPQKIYLVPDGKGGFVEYHWTGTKWDPIGMVEFDISKYSTTQEMMNAIEAAGILTLNSAKTYTDEQIAGISVDPQVFYWDGGTQQAGIDFWNNVMQINDTTDVLVAVIGKSMSDINHLELIKVQKNSIRTNKQTDCFNYIVYNNEDVFTNSNSTYNIYSTYLQFTIENDIITHISKPTTLVLTTHFLGTDVDYSTPYEPQYPGSPATKKYVDDSIATNITNVLNASY